MRESLLFFFLLLIHSVDICFAVSGEVNNAILSSSNFLKNHHSLNQSHVKANEFKNHLINTFDTCTWDALVIANIPGLSWDHYLQHEGIFKNVQTLLERSGTIEQVSSISNVGSLGKTKLINDVMWTIEKKCKVLEEHSLYIAGNTTLEGFEKYIDTNKRMILISYDDDFLTVDENDTSHSGDDIEDRLMLIDDELGKIFGAIPSPRTSLLIMGSHDIATTKPNVFNRIFNKNIKDMEINKLSKFSEQKKKEAIEKRGKFHAYKPKFEPSADDNNGMLFTEIKAEIIKFYRDNKKQIEVVGAKGQLFSDHPEFDKLLSELSHLLFDVNGDVSTLQQFIDTLESGLATGNSINKILTKSLNNIEMVTEKMKKLKTVLDELLAIDRSLLDNQRLISRDKIVRDIDFSVKEFKRCQMRLKNFDEKLAEVNKSALLQEETEALESDPSSANLLPDHHRMQMIVERNTQALSEANYQNNLYAQRNAEIGRIQSNIQDVNRIFKDLSAMVLEQGMMVDTIESNMYSSKIFFYFFFILLMVFLLMIMASL
ncbi:unnamed protein product [Hanseniaspora opuntiae]